MGSLTSTPKIPQRQQVVYMPATAPAPAISQPSPKDAPPPTDDAGNAEQARKKSLFARNRGRFGTIATSLRGFLGEAKSSARKTLLGE